MSIIKLCERLGGWGAVLGLLAAVLCLTGCHTQASKKSATHAPDAPAGATGSPVGAAGGSLEPEVLRIGDSLTITFADLPEVRPPSQVKIKEDGSITLFLNETFTAAGKTPGNLETEIRDRYVPRYFHYMTVTITREVQTLYYYLNGEVKAPARQVYVSRITVLKAIASSGGFTDFANKRAVQLTRLDGRKIKVNCIKALSDPNLDLEVYPGDQIYVPRKLL